MSDKYQLSRRKALAALGTIGVAGAGAGMGTSALFSDEESFDGNIVQAGSLNLILRGGVIATNREGGISNSDVEVAGAAEVENNGEVGLVLNLADVKPGDCYVIHTDEVIQDNRAYLEMSLEEVEDTEGSPMYNEPEPEPPNEGPDGDSDGGELDDKMNVTLYYGGNDVTGSLVGPGTDSDTVTCDNVQSVSPSSSPLVEAQDLQDAFDGLAEGSDTAPGDAGINDEFVPSDGSGNALELEPGVWRKFWKFELPKSVGNVVQGDTVTFNINARIAQARNNDASSPNWG